MKKAGKIAWAVYALVGTLLFFWDQSARGEHIAGSLIVAGYSLPSSLLLVLLDRLFPGLVQPPVSIWLLMVGPNGWLLYRLFGLSARKKEPIQPLETTRGK